MEQGDTLLTIPEAARCARCSTGTVYRAIRNGELAVLRLGPRGRYRVSPEALEAWWGRLDGLPEADLHPDRSGSLSRSERVRLLAESDGSRRDVEVSPGTWVLNARPLTAEEHTAYVSATPDEREDARVLLDAAAELVLARLVSVADRFEELVTQAKPKMESE
jgi:excisionase family DNA binding protein